MSVLAPVRARSKLAAREWLRLVSRIFMAPIRAISARHASVGCTGSMQRFPSAWRTRWPLKSYPWGSENHAQVKTSATISSIVQLPFEDGSHVALDSLRYARGYRLDQESPDPLDSPPWSAEKRTGRLSVIFSLPSCWLVTSISCCAPGRPAGITIRPL